MSHHLFIGRTRWPLLHVPNLQILTGVLSNPNDDDEYERDAVHYRLK